MTGSLHPAKLRYRAPLFWQRNEFYEKRKIASDRALPEPAGAEDATWAAKPSGLAPIPCRLLPLRRLLGRNLDHGLLASLQEADPALVKRLLFQLFGPPFWNLVP